MGRTSEIILTPSLFSLLFYLSIPHFVVLMHTRRLILKRCELQLQATEMMSDSSKIRDNVASCSMGYGVYVCKLLYL